MSLTSEQRERIEDFVAALRSGEYRQIDGVLGRQRDLDGRHYCCEGIAAERYGQKLGHDVEWVGSQLRLDGEYDYAPNEFWEQMGLAAREGADDNTSFAFVLPDGLLIKNLRASELAYMALNDDGLTFPQIADLIEWQFLS
jgi:hypothetical protein